MNVKNIFQWLLRLAAAIIMLQTLAFKFTAHPESVALFTQIGMEPWGRIGIGVLELIASLLIIIPRTTLMGAILGIGLMSGAIFFHLTILGIRYNDSTLLFTYAVIVFASCCILVYFDRKKIHSLLKLKF